MRALLLPSGLRPPESRLPAAIATLRRSRRRRSALLLSRSMYDGPDFGLVINVDDVGDIDDRDGPVELGLTRTLEPAYTADEGFERLRDALLELKNNPSCAVSGVIRYQVPVPPSTKALSWLCCQCRNSLQVPLFYFSRKSAFEEDPGSDSVNQMVEASGVGTAIFVHGSCHSAKGLTLLSRYLPVESPTINAYGSTNTNHTKDLSPEENEAGPFYFFIPQIELNEFNGYCLLASTVVWDDSYFHTFERSVRVLESKFMQMNNYDASANKFSDQIMANCISWEQLMVDTDKTVLIPLNADVLPKIQFDSIQKENLLTSHQSFVQFSATTTSGFNMLSNSRGTSFCVKECSNINVVWTSLIVEELVRLGFTYFCIAPGSRSSPLAISATKHPLTTCISCYDERSIGFHAIGYAKGSRKPAVVITSSGTAVSNLLPAVVEASQDFIPLLLLTADRPPELHDAGANQTIDQVNHFGKFVRYFFTLPPPTDQISARMVLTTVDSASYIATKEPQGPVHLNCAFREPLDDSCKDWTSDCLTGLDKWSRTLEPFTKYIRAQNLSVPKSCSSSMLEVLEVIRGAQQGLLVFGSIQSEDDIWAATLLAQHLSWPVFADIMSGLRLRRILYHFPELRRRILFVDQLDHILLSSQAKNWIKPDVILQIGSRITSKRVCDHLESCFPASHIFVAEHQYRHDPSHIITHRIQCSIIEFARTLSKVHSPERGQRWKHVLQVLNSAALQEILFQMHSEDTLTEPFVAHVIGERVCADSALFIGNSMAIRDLDMYGKGWLQSPESCRDMLHGKHFFQGFSVAGNRGASGIDGLLSSAVGYSAGCFKRVICVIGDISFLHDTNGLSLLNQRARRKPITVVVINNQGGAIFKFLPIAKTVEADILKKFFYTEHNISIHQLCEAHKVRHFLAQTKLEFRDALVRAQAERTDCIIEVKSSIEDNAKFHKLYSEILNISFLL